MKFMVRMSFTRARFKMNSEDGEQDLVVWCIIFEDVMEKSLVNIVIIHAAPSQLPNEKFDFDLQMRLRSLVVNRVWSYGRSRTPHFDVSHIVAVLLFKYK
jgi:hypothetical protein